jgi:urease accessory protein
MAMSALLLLADGRFPAGGHAHSAGVEAAVADGRVVDMASLADFTEGRLRTVALVDAALAMATIARIADVAGARSEDSRIERSRAIDGFGDPAEAKAGAIGSSDAAACRALLDRLDAEVDARTPAPPLRAASRRLGRQLLRAAARCWPSPLLALAMASQRDVHQAVAFGLVGTAAGLDVVDVGHLTTHHAVTTPMQAGVRLLGLDPFAAAAATAALATVAASIVDDAHRLALGPLEALPARSATLVDLAAMLHASADARLFAT